MTTPGITGLFNKNCLKSAMEQKITCAPGDNTWDGIQTNISLVSEESQFHSIYSIEETHGKHQALRAKNHGAVFPILPDSHHCRKPTAGACAASSLCNVHRVEN